ncbi:MAG: hypothetical protein PHQ23_14265, partial [Candidatus Wallbacteria bacterium]|nr:hypothetical protein [Candidatus Wallbacteria bacterium]
MFKRRHTVLVLLLIFSCLLSAGEKVLRKTISHSRDQFTDSKNWSERITIPADWKKSGYVFTRFELRPTNARVMALNPVLNAQTFSFTFRLLKSFTEKASGSLTVLLYANKNAYPQNPAYPVSPIQPSNKNWFYPGQSYTVPCDRTRKIHYVDVRWTDAGGNSKATLYVDNKSLGSKSVGNFTNARWTVNRFATTLRLQVSKDAVQILSCNVIYYGNSINYPNNPAYPSNPYNPYPNNPSYPTNPYNPYNPYPTNPTYPTNP